MQWHLDHFRCITLSLVMGLSLISRDRGSVNFVLMSSDSVTTEVVVYFYSELSFIYKDMTSSPRTIKGFILVLLLITCHAYRSVGDGK